MINFPSPKPSTRISIRTFARISNCLATFILAAILFFPLSTLGKNFKIKFATVAPEGTPWSDKIQELKKRVLKESGGSLLLIPYLGGQLGGEKETLRSLRSGRLQMWAGSIGALATLVPQLQLLEFPYLFHTLDEADYLLDDVLFEPVSKILDKKGFVMHSWNENGWRHIGTKKKPVTSPGDLKGVKIRSQQSKLHQQMWRAWGANPVAISITEVLTSLQTGVVEGFDNSTLFATATGWHGAIKHFSLTQHMYQPAIIIINKKFWSRLSPEQKKILKGDPRAFAQESRAAVRAIEPEIHKIMMAEGVSVHTLSQKQKAAFAKKASSIYPQFRKAVGPALYDKVLAALKEYRKAKN